MEKLDKDEFFFLSSKLSSWKLNAFIAYCCERMLPNFEKFSRSTAWGDYGVLRSALDVIWDRVISDDVSINYSAIASSCDTQAPDTEMFSSEYTSAALDAANAIAIAVGSLNEPKAFDISCLARDTVDMFVQYYENIDPRSEDIDSVITESALMQREILIQKRSLVVLSSLGEDRERLARLLMLEWSHLNAGSLP